MRAQDIPSPAGLPPISHSIMEFMDPASKGSHTPTYTTNPMYLTSSPFLRHSRHLCTCPNFTSAVPPTTDGAPTSWGCLRYDHTRPSTHHAFQTDNNIQQPPSTVSGSPLSKKALGDKVTALWRRDTKITLKKKDKKDDKKQHS
jgi:hypothetical protein